MVSTIQINPSLYYEPGFIQLHPSLECLTSKGIIYAMVYVALLFNTVIAINNQLINNDFTCSDLTNNQSM